MIQFNTKKDIENYARLLEEVFDIQGVMAFAWYMLSRTKYVVEGDMGYRIPMLIIEGERGTGKTELAQAIAAIDTEEGLPANACIHSLAAMAPSLVRKLVNENAGFTVLEELKPESARVTDTLKQRRKKGPLVMVTSVSKAAVKRLSEKGIVVELPQRHFTSRAHSLLEELHKIEKEAWGYRQLMEYSPYKFEGAYKEWKDELTSYINDMGMSHLTVTAMRHVSYYAMPIAVWDCQDLDTDIQNRLATYILRCLDKRLHLAMPDKKRTVLQRIVDDSGAVTLTWHHPDEEGQSIVFDDELLFKGFVHMLRMMDATNAGSVDVCM